jgi:hypothetical protein
MGIEEIFGLEKMSVLQCQQAAKDIGFDKATFTLVGPRGELKAKWLDAYMGLFEIEGQEGFLMVKEFQFMPDIYCKDLMPGKEGQ